LIHDLQKVLAIEAHLGEAVLRRNRQANRAPAGPTAIRIRRNSDTMKTPSARRMVKVTLNVSLFEPQEINP